MNRISEDLDADTSALRLATEARKAFFAYFDEHNSELPFGSVPGLEYQTIGGSETATVPARLMGLPYDDLRVGFTWGTDVNGRCIKTHMLGTAETIYYVVIGVPKKPERESVDVIWGMKWSSFVHEFIHYLDHRRKTTNRPWQGRAKTNRGISRAIRNRRNPLADRKDPREYYNDPLEFNAFYQQWVDAVLDIISNKIYYGKKNIETYGSEADPLDFYKSPKDFLLSMERQMNRNGSHRDDWFTYMSPETKQRFMKRAARLYSAIKSEWPDINMIRPRVGKLAKNDAY